MRTAIFIIMLSAAPVLASAQAPTIALGTRVRINALQKPSIVTGSLTSQSADSLIISTAGDLRRAVPAASITRIRISAGKSHGTGAIQGFNFGAISGGLVAVFLATQGNFSESVPPLFGVAVGTIGAVMGGAIGAAIGGVFGAEKWTTTYTNPVRVK